MITDLQRNRFCLKTLGFIIDINKQLANDVFTHFPDKTALILKYRFLF